MRVVMITIAMLFVAIPAFANTVLNDGLGTYDTRGAWKDVAGTENRWTSTLTISTEETSDDSLTLVLHEVLTVYDTEGSTEITETIKYVHKGNDFYSVVIEGDVVGEAYCYGLYCHTSYTHNGQSFEEGMYFSADRKQIVRNGSAVIADRDYTFAFRGLSTKKGN